MIQKFAPGHSSVVLVFDGAVGLITDGKCASAARNDSRPGVKHASVATLFRQVAHAGFWWVSAGIVLNSTGAPSDGFFLEASAKGFRCAFSLVRVRVR